MGQIHAQIAMRKGGPSSPGGGRIDPATANVCGIICNIRHSASGWARSGNAPRSCAEALEPQPQS
eukprot:8473518-Pyramimonas_sp.AAC.1